MVFSFSVAPTICTQICHDFGFSLFSGDAFSRNGMITLWRIVRFRLTFSTFLLLASFVGNGVGATFLDVLIQIELFHSMTRRHPSLYTPTARV